jgi:hypothetical protein
MINKIKILNMSKKFLAEIRKIEYNNLIGLISEKEKKEQETKLMLSQITKESKKVKQVVKVPIKVNEKYESSIYMKSESLNYIYN